MMMMTYIRTSKDQSIRSVGGWDTGFGWRNCSGFPRPQGLWYSSSQTEFDAIQSWHWAKALRIKWTDRRTNESVLEEMELKERVCCNVRKWKFQCCGCVINSQDLLARSHQELRGRSAHWSRSGVGSHHTPPKLRLRSHCQASWRHASPPSTPVSCWSDSRPSSRPKLEASPRPSQQPMDWPATQATKGQQQHATSWPVEKIHHTWSCGSDATVLDD